MELKLDIIKIAEEKKLTVEVDDNILVIGSSEKEAIFIYSRNMHWSKQLKDQLVLLLSSFAHNSSINEHKNMKLRDNTGYEMIN